MYRLSLPNNCVVGRVYTLILLHICATKCLPSFVSIRFPTTIPKDKRSQMHPSLILLAIASPGKVGWSERKRWETQTAIRSAGKSFVQIDGTERVCQNLHFIQSTFLFIFWLEPWKGVALAICVWGNANFKDYQSVKKKRTSELPLTVSQWPQVLKSGHQMIWIVHSSQQFCSVKRRFQHSDQNVGLDFIW